MTINTQRESTSASSPAHALDMAELLHTYESSRTGITTADAERRLAANGPNATPTAPKPGLLAQIFAHLNDVLVIILLIAAALKAIIGDWVDFSIILIVAVVNVAVGMIQEGKAEKALDSIKSMLALTAITSRDGTWETIDAQQLVVGDVVRLRSGDRIPADARVLESTNLQVDESVLTGESDSVLKGVGIVAHDAAIGDRTNMLHSGTLVTAGTGIALITATGSRTEIGRIQTLIDEVETLETPLTRQLAQLGKTLAIIVGIMAAVMVFLGLVVHGFTASETISATIGFAVAAIPEGLPALVTITLAMGVQQMARRNAITRKLTAVEALGSVTTICSDKTGTLTKNEMTARTLVTASQTFTITGEGYEPQGQLLKDGVPVDLDGTETVGRILAAASLCNDAQVFEEDNQWKLAGAPTEGAIRVMVIKSGVNVDGRRIALLPFESAHKFMATVDAYTLDSYNLDSYNLDSSTLGSAFAEVPADAVTAQPDTIQRLHVVGAPDRLLARATQQLNEDGSLSTINKDYWNSTMDSLGAQGLRVLAIAGREATEQEANGTHSLTLTDVNDLAMYALVGIVDPPRPEATQAIKECQRAGIDVVMITGDHAGTATAIAAELGIVEKHSDGTYTCPTNPTSHDVVLTGADLDHLDATELRTAVQTVRVFARTSPEHKLRIVQALQDNGEVVAMTGDGVNDAPALRKADVGVAMGIKGTEATKEAADVVLADDNFATIERAVEEGRRIFDNIRKSVVFLLPTNGAQSLVILLAVLFGWALPLTPAQILWVNMITAVTLSLALAYEPAEPGLMDRAPRDPREGVLTRGALLHVLLVSLLIGGAALLVVWLETARGSSPAIAQTTAVTTLSLAQLAYLFNCRFLHRSSFTLDVLRGNKMVWIAAGALVAVQIAFTLVPALNTWFGSTPIDLGRWGVALGLSIMVFCVVEIGKMVQRRRVG